MNNFSKIVIILLIVLTFFFVKDKFGSNIDGMLSSIKGFDGININLGQNDNETKTEESEQVKTPTEVPTKAEEPAKEKESATVYFLALDSNDNGIYKKVVREVPLNEDKLDFAIKELLKGPNLVEKSMGAYSEIPKETKLLGIKHKGNKVIIDFSSDFQYGGGTDSVYSRMMQLIKTSLNNTNKKSVYLYLDGKQINFIGGEGIMITQPLNENSLDM